VLCLAPSAGWYLREGPQTCSIAESVLVSAGLDLVPAFFPLESLTIVGILSLVGRATLLRLSNRAALSAWSFSLLAVAMAALSLSSAAGANGWPERSCDDLVGLGAKLGFESAGMLCLVSDLREKRY
jgi:hypothetical protein